MTLGQDPLGTIAVFNNRHLLTHRSLTRWTPTPSQTSTVIHKCRCLESQMLQTWCTQTVPLMCLITAKTSYLIDATIKLKKPIAIEINNKRLKLILCESRRWLLAVEQTHQSADLATIIQIQMKLAESKSLVASIRTRWARCKSRTNQYQFNSTKVSITAMVPW